MGGDDTKDRKRKASSDEHLPTYEVKRRHEDNSFPSHELQSSSSAIQPCCKVVDGRETVNLLMSRGYLRPKARAALLPYFDELDKHISAYYNHLVTGCVAGVLINEPNPGVGNYLTYLHRYFQNYGLRLTLSDGIRLVKFLYLVITKPGQYREVMYLAAKIADHVISNSRMTYKDLQLDWRPVYKLYCAAKYGKLENIDADKLQNAVYKLKRFYPIEQAPEIWEALQVHLSPRGDDKHFFDLCLRFLPVQMTAEEHLKYGAGLWWDELWKLYEIVEMGAVWGDDLPYLFSVVYRWCPHWRDISYLYEDLFTRILRSMQLIIRQGKVAVGDGTGTVSILAFSTWVADLLGGPNSCQPQLDRLMLCLEAFMHPSNTDEYSKAILVFMNKVCDRVRERVYDERWKKHKRKIPQEYYLTDEDIHKFVQSMLQTTLTAIYNEVSFDKFSISKILMCLSALSPELVIPKFLEHTYPALDAVCEPHRLLNTLECLIEVVYQIAADEKPRVFKDPLDIWTEHDENVLDYYPFVAEHRKQHLYKEFRTIRPHLIYLLEALTCAIDINDIQKTALSLQNMNLIFFLVPNIDCSPCLELRDDLSDDEKILCRLTARLPGLTDNILEKILDIIRNLSVCAPKNDSELLGGLKDDTVTHGEEEKNLRRAIDCCINALLCNSSPDITTKVIDKIYDFISSNEFDSSIATELSTAIVAQSVFARPENWPRFAQYVLKNLKNILTPEVRRQKDLSSTALWFINLASALFCTTSESFVQNKKMCFELIDLLTDCECKFAHDVGCQGMWYCLYMLSRIYTMQQQILKDQFGRNLKDWVPIRDWGSTYQEHEVTLAWHVPDEMRKDTVAEILRRFVYPLLEKMRTTRPSSYQEYKKFSHDLRRYLRQVNMAYCGAFTCLPMPEAGRIGIVNMQDKILPSMRFGQTHITNKYWDVPYTDGSNVREVILDTMNKLVDMMNSLVETKTTRKSSTAEKETKDGDDTSMEAEDTQALTMIISILKNIIDDKGIDAGEKNSMAQQTDYVFSHLSDPTLMGKKLTMNAFDSYLYKMHLEYCCNEDGMNYYPFQREVVGLLVKLALNDYPEVRNNARSELNHVLALYPDARKDVIETMAALFQDKASTPEKIKAALEITRDNKWVASGLVQERLILWPALVRIPVIDRPVYNLVLDEILCQLSKMTTVDRSDAEEPELLEYAKAWWKELPKDGLWEEWKDSKQIDIGRETRISKLAQAEETRAKLVACLLDLYHDKGIHRLRNKMARSMLWKCQRAKAKTATIKILLSKMVSDDIHVRTDCADEICFWLRKNKPLTRRVIWNCPENIPTKHPLLCGIRKNNLCVAYDSQNLPNTKEKWESTVFISKLTGCHKWPKTLSVPAPEPAVERGPLSEEEETIVVFFENRDNIKKAFEALVLEKEELAELDANIYRMIKYVLRNFPNHPKILENVLFFLKKALASRKHTEQRAAADLFLGVVKGTRHYPYETLDSMWKWLAPAVDHLIDHLNSEAETIWATVMPSIFYKEDPRRYWWLIEQIILGMQRPALSAYHQAARSGLVSARQWRDIEIRKRITDIAWKQLPTATMEMQRIGISNALRVISTVDEANIFNDFSDIPERFRLRGTDHWLERFMEKMESIVDTPSSTKSEPSEINHHDMDQHLKHALTMVLDMAKGDLDPSGMSKLLSENNLTLLDDNVDRHGRIYLRCCLEFLLQYYEECMTCLTPGIVKLIPTLLEYSNDDESTDNSMFKDNDIMTNASVLIHDYMSGLYVNEDFADRLLAVLTETYDRTCLWRVKVSVLKFFQVIVFSNVYIYERENRPESVANLVYNGLGDEQIEVRQEAARCLETLVHFAYIKLDQPLLDRMEAMLSSECKWQQHGSILGYGAIVAAHPFTMPPLVVPAIQVICRNSHKNPQAQAAVTNVIREFRRSHRDNWSSTCKVLGPDLVYQIENVIAPVYYA